MAKKILLIDADSTIPNIALGKISTYFKNKGCNVEYKKLNIPYYPNRKKKHIFIDTDKYYKVFCSVIFDGSINYIHGNNIIYGGTGYNLIKRLPDKIEKLEIDYSLFGDNKFSYGYISRGCIRRCKFCKVWEKEGMIKQVNTIDQIVRHKKVRFLDNNILALPNCNEILEELIKKNIRCNFYQGLDIRLLDEKKSLLLSKLNYMQEYIFAFDDILIKKTIKNKIQLLGWSNEWQIKFFVYIENGMDCSNVVKRLRFLRKNKFLPYVMRNINCWDSKYSFFYTDLAAWANQPNLFKMMDFDEYVGKRHTKNKVRVDLIRNLWNNN